MKVDQCAIDTRQPSGGNFRTAPSIQQGDRNAYVDMLRGAAILLVMSLHYSLSYRLQASPLQGLLSIQTLRAIFYNGNYGVSIFFVISGFLITSNIVQRYGSLASVDLSHFYKLRLFRLYPLVVLALLVIAVLGALGLSNFSNHMGDTKLGGGFFLIANLSVLTFWHNILMQDVGYFNYAMNIYWSLSVEEVFYLIYPLMLVLARRNWQLIALACLCAVAAPVYRAIHRDDELFYLYGNVACVDMLAYGCVAAIVAGKLTLSRVVRRCAAALTCCAMAWIYMRGIRGNESLGATFLGIFTAMCLVAVSGLRAGNVTRRLAYPLTWLGSHSYELYLFHIVVLGIMVDVVPKATMPMNLKLPMFALFLMLSAIAAWATARFVGTPLNRMLRSRYAGAGARRLLSA